MTHIRVAAALVAAALVASCSTGTDSSGTAAPSPTTAAAPEVTTEATPDATPDAASALPDIPVRPAQDAAVAPPPAPVRVTVADLDVDMLVVGVGTEPDGTMSVPAAGSEAGWYRFGSAPASPTGTTVLASHVDTLAEGLGPFARLREAQAGSSVTVTDAAGVVHSYTVTSVERIPKPDAPLDAIFDRAGPPRLVLVTCGGAWDASVGHYEDNIIVTATPSV